MAIPDGPIKVILKNSLNEDLVLESGYPPPFPDVIPIESERGFSVDAGCRHAAYKFQTAVCNSRSERKWIIAWSDEANDFDPEQKKVFTQILYPTEAFELDEIQNTLAKSGYCCKVGKGQFVSDICWSGTTLKATLRYSDDANNPGPRA